MRLLAATDFSDTSINAIRWALELVRSAGSGAVEIVHCIDYNNRADVFLRIDEWLREQAAKDMVTLESKLSADFEDVNYTTSVHKASSKTFIPQYAEKKEYDFIVMGTTGLSMLKEITIGSVTEYIATHSQVPLLAIPAETPYKGFQDIVVAFEGSEKDAEVNWSTVKTIAAQYSPHIHLAHVVEREKSVEVPQEMAWALDELEYEIKYVDYQHSVAFSLNSFAQKVGADLIVFAHERKNWFGRMFTKSVTKAEFFGLETALMILPK